MLLNSGIQRGIDFSKPETIDLNIAQQEVTTNYTAYLYLLKYFLPHLIELSAAPTYKETSVILTTSGLALTPMKRCGNYCASKAALHQLIMTMREQLRDTGVRVIELLPPAVQTELHDSKNQPDIKNGGQIGMPLEQWLNTTWHGLLEEKESIPVGSAEKSWRWEEERYKDFIAMDQMFRKEGLA